MALLMVAMFIALPLAELYLLIKLGSLIGAGPTIALLVIKALIGTVLLRLQGAAALKRATKAVQQGQVPLGPMVDGMGLMLAGVLLVTPGLITDTFGLLLFIPAVRRWLFQTVVRKADARVDVFTTTPEPDQRSQARAENPQPSRKTPDGQGPIIEGEFERLDEKTVRPNQDRRQQTGPNETSPPRHRHNGKSPWLH